jgi:hypothetical protein
LPTLRLINLAHLTMLGLGIDQFLLRPLATPILPPGRHFASLVRPAAEVCNIGANSG